MVHGENSIHSLSALYNRAPLSRGDHKGLLDNDVLPRLKGAHRERSVKFIRSRDNHKVDTRIIEKLLCGGNHPRRWELLPHLFGPRRNNRGELKTRNRTQHSGVKDLTRQSEPYNPNSNLFHGPTVARQRALRQAES